MGILFYWMSNDTDQPFITGHQSLVPISPPSLMMQDTFSHRKLVFLINLQVDNVKNITPSSYKTPSAPFKAIYIPMDKHDQGKEKWCLEQSA